MAELLSVSASILGVVVPTMHGIRVLLADLKQLKDAPENLKALKHDIHSVESAVASVRAIEDGEWDTLGPEVSNNAKSTVQMIGTACSTFRNDLQNWTRHSQGQSLSWRDRSTFGFWKQSHIKSMKGQLQNCQATITNVVSIATLYSSIRHAHMTEDIRTIVAVRQGEISTAIQITNSQSAEVDRMIQDADAPDLMQDEECSNAARQLRGEQDALSLSQRLFDELLLKVQEPAISQAMAEHQARPVYNTSFSGANHGGQQIGVSNAPIHFTSGAR
ncbi:hypothetical protein N7495_002631 [Penicillium taxi]|uniref:uncharacterized protein n=1 Tax=Penicillium taxi TaxID=168475 RepID=UPI002544E401|nr:uncharacterized protein N7495_002631 [Penicillium taxi]KAJ5902103.1 hypothetical protein N7495_002631 [Penicillium taxi]